jgi:hypothetical protein
MAAVLFMPDAYQHGFQNKLMSYNFLQQVNPGGLYGVSLIAAAWMFMLNACKTGRWPAILFAYGIVLVSVVYKAQLFVANAYLMMIYPCFFFRPVKPRWRVAAGFALTGLFVLVVSLSQNMASVPTLRLDGTGIWKFSHLVLITFDPGMLRTFYFVHLDDEVPPAYHLIAAGMLLVTTFGCWLAACVILFFVKKAGTERAAHLFPILVIVNYIVMAVGLAVDEKQIGMPEELLHRPMVWAYFVVVAWTGAAAYVCLAGHGPPKSRLARIATAAFAVLILAVPLKLGHNLQTMPMWPGFGKFPDFNLMPAAFPQAAAYIRSHSDPSAVIQDSGNDEKLALSALAERQDFAAYSEIEEIRLPAGMHERIASLEAFKQMTSAAEIEKYARENGISWYLLHPRTQVAWPSAFLKTAVFESSGYRLYHFPQ